MSLSEHVGRSQKLDCINPFLGVMVITGMEKNTNWIFEFPVLDDHDPHATCNISG
jgi:hypothetical protein